MTQVFRCSESMLPALFRDTALPPTPEQMALWKKPKRAQVPRKQQSHPRDPLLSTSSHTSSIGLLGTYRTYANNFIPIPHKSNVEHPLPLEMVAVGVLVRMHALKKAWANDSLAK